MKKVLFVLCLLLVTGCHQQQMKDSENPSIPVDANSVVEESSNVIQESEQTEVISASENTVELENPDIAVSIEEEQVMHEVNQIEQEVTTLLETESSSTLKEKVASKFITLVDFVYYDEPMNGVYFKDLTASAQEKVRSILERMDRAIENKIPNYKDTLKSKYQTALSYLKEKTSQAKEKLESAIGSENYENLVESKEDMKESFQNAAEVITEGASQIYESGKEKVSNWYQNFKEKYKK